MKRVFLICLLIHINKIFGLEDYGPRDYPQDCLVGKSVGSCVPLPECVHIVSQLRDSGTARKALTLTHQRKCGFANVNVMICCLESEIKVDLRFGSNKTAGSDITEDLQSGIYVERFDEPPMCGGGILPIDDGICPQRSKRQTYMTSVPFVTEGRLVEPGFAPWMALLGYTPSASFWECGGSIITKRHILTAAHCINDRLLLVRAGELNLASDNDGAAPADYLVKRKIPHEHYDDRTHVNDIGILLLEQNIVFSNLVQTICLPNFKNPTERPEVGALASIAGWGRVSYLGVQSSQLLYATINIFETSYCQQQYRNYSNAVIDERMICAGDPDGLKDSCKGDSGGPLMFKMCPEDGSWYYAQVGVVSYGLECARLGYPGVYTRVAHYIPWIREKIIRKSN